MISRDYVISAIVHADGMGAVVGVTEAAMVGGGGRPPAGRVPFYQSAKCIHGRPRREGKWYTSLSIIDLLIGPAHGGRAAPGRKVVGSECSTPRTTARSIGCSSRGRGIEPDREHLRCDLPGVDSQDGRGGGKRGSAAWRRRVLSTSLGNCPGKAAVLQSQPGPVGLDRIGLHAGKRPTTTSKAVAAAVDALQPRFVLPVRPRAAFR